MDSRPASIASSRRSLLNHALIFERARGLLTKLSQSRLGPACSPLFVTISTTSPLLSLDSRGTSLPFTFAPAQRRPTSVCTENAKSTGVEPPGSATTEPFGVNTNTSGLPRSKRRASRNSDGSSVSFCHSCNWRSHNISGELESGSPPCLYFQCAAIPNSARVCISYVRICISIALPLGPMTVV